jgi:hypothetical protein
MNSNLSEPVARARARARARLSIPHKFGAFRWLGHATIRLSKREPTACAREISRYSSRVRSRPPKPSSTNKHPRLEIRTAADDFVHSAMSQHVVATALARMRSPRNRTHTELPTTPPVAPTFPQRGLQNTAATHPCKRRLQRFTHCSSSGPLVPRGGRRPTEGCPMADSAVLCPRGTQRSEAERAWARRSPRSMSLTALTTRGTDRSASGNCAISTVVPDLPTPSRAGEIHHRRGCKAV